MIIALIMNFFEKITVDNVVDFIKLGIQNILFN